VHSSVGRCASDPSKTRQKSTVLWDAALTTRLPLPRVLSAYSSTNLLRVLSRIERDALEAFVLRRRLDQFPFSVCHPRRVLYSATRFGPSYLYRDSPRSRAARWHRRYRRTKCWLGTQHRRHRRQCHRPSRDSLLKPLQTSAIPPPPRMARNPVPALSSWTSSSRMGLIQRTSERRPRRCCPRTEFQQTPC